MPRPKDSTALQLVIRDDAPPPPDWSPDKFEAYFGGPIGNIYHTAQGYKRRGFGTSTTIPPKPVAVKAVLDFLENNSGWYTSVAISTRIGMKAGNVMTTLRIDGRVQAQKKGTNVYIYSRLESER
jgi:hypothetical protein